MTKDEPVNFKAKKQTKQERSKLIARSGLSVMEKQNKMREEAAKKKKEEALKRKAQQQDESNSPQPKYDRLATLKKGAKKVGLDSTEKLQR